MLFDMRVSQGLAAVVGASAVNAASIPDSAASQIIEKDVVIIGGGASGAHAAVRLREDYGKSIVIVEKQDNLVSTLYY